MTSTVEPVSRRQALMAKMRKPAVKDGPGPGRSGPELAEPRHGESEPPKSRGAVVLRVFAMAVAFAAMVAFAAVLAKITLVPSAASDGIAHANLQPGDSLRQYFQDYTAAAALKQVGGNLLLGVPFGILLPVMLPKARGAVRVLLITGLVMVLVELVQGAVVQGRSFDVDDVILNTTGALVGYLLLGRRLGRAIHPPRRHWWQRFSRDRQPAPPHP